MKYLVNYYMTKHKSEDYKLSAVKYYLKIKNQENTSEIYGLP